MGTGITESEAYDIVSHGDPSVIECQYCGALPSDDRIHQGTRVCERCEEHLENNGVGKQ